MRYFLVVGEASGDLHAANLMKGILKEDPDAEFRFVGGDKMKSVGGTLIKHYASMAFMGIIKVLANLRQTKQNFQLVAEELKAFQPDLVILVDYPGFNLRVAKIAKSYGLKTYYYISPKIWAWKEGRIKKIKRFVDEVFSILPFEVEYFKKHNYKVHYVGNPTLDEITNRECKDETKEEFAKRNQLNVSKPIVALLAGSRLQEIDRLLPLMIEVSERFKNCQFVLAGAPSIDSSVYEKYLEGSDVPVVYNETFALLQNSDAALVTSGTATLETGVLKIPQVVCYKAEGGILAEWVKKIFIKVPYFSLVNLILDKEAVLELFQSDCTVDAVSNELEKLLNNKEYRQNMIQNYTEMNSILGEVGAGHIAAKKMLELYQKN